MLRPLLPPDEQRRADQYPVSAHRDRFIVAHGALRRLIAEYGALDTFDSPFARKSRGKPELAAGTDLRFNLAHSGEVALVAFARSQEVGIDVERIRAEVDTERVARRFFSPRELTALLALPSPRRREAFFRLWVQKEAYMKGRGEGVLLGIDHFDVTADPDRAPGLLADRRDPAALGRWSLSTFEPQPGFLGAVAVEGGPVRIEHYSWE